MSEDDPKKIWSTLWREGLRALSLGWDLAIPIFGGVLVGHMLDVWLGTTYIFTLGLMMLGVMLAYYNLARVIRRVGAYNQTRKRQGEEEKDEER